MAAHRGLYQSGGLLSLWDSHCCISRLLDAVKREGPLDRNTNWCFCSDNSTFYCYKLRKLGKTGLFSTLLLLDAFDLSLAQESRLLWLVAKMLGGKKEEKIGLSEIIPVLTAYWIPNFFILFHVLVGSEFPSIFLSINHSHHHDSIKDDLRRTTLRCSTSLLVIDCLFNGVISSGFLTLQASKARERIFGADFQ